MSCARFTRRYLYYVMRDAQSGDGDDEGHHDVDVRHPGEAGSDKGP